MLAKVEDKEESKLSGGNIVRVNNKIKLRETGKT